MLEGVPASEVCLYSAGVPLDNELSVGSLSSFELELTVPLKGGKVHGSLARAGKVKGQTPKVIILCSVIVISFVNCFRNLKFI